MKLSELILAEVARRAEEIDGYKRLSDLRIGVSIDRNGVAYLRLEPRTYTAKLGVVSCAEEN